MSDTKNIKLGPCHVYYGGVDLGFTQGGVEVSVTTQTHKVMVDQFGKSTVNEIIMSRDVAVKVPLAETTLVNLVKIMPGATLIESSGVKATATATLAATATALDSITINGITFTWQTTPILASDVALGTSATTSAANLVAAVNAYLDTNLEIVASNVAGVVTFTADNYGALFNAYTLAKSGTNITLSGATFTGGVDPTKQRVSVPTAVGSSLLAISQRLVLHPQANLDTNLTEDFIIPLAATSGALQFAYDVDKERIYNVSFQGYPNPTTTELFILGDTSF